MNIRDITTSATYPARKAKPVDIQSPVSPVLMRHARAVLWADAHPSSVAVSLDVRLMSEANARGSWHHGAQRAKAHRAAAFRALRTTEDQLLNLSGPLIIILTRIAPRSLDSDNLARSCKSLRDGVADWLGRNDGDASLTWLTQQAKGPYGARIEIWRWEP